MKTKVMLFTGLLLLFRCAAWAGGSFDVCYNPQDKANAGRLIAIAAPIYAGGSIPQSLGPVDCSLIAASVLGQAFIMGSTVAGLPWAGKRDTGTVIIELRIYGGVKLGLMGVPKSGFNVSSDLLVIGENGLEAGPVATVTNLTPSGNAFEITY